MGDENLLFSIIEDILGKPKKKNVNKKQFSFDCPVCSAEKGLTDGDGKGNLELNLNKNVYQCWACGETHHTHGSIIKLIKKFGNQSHVQRLKQLGLDLDDIKTDLTKVKRESVHLLPPGFISFKDGNPKTLEYKRAWNYLTKERNISEEIIYDFNIGYVPNGQYINRVVIPSYGMDNEINYWVTRTFLNVKPKYLNPDADKELIIFNENRINWDGTVYLVEGPFDHIVTPNSIPLLGKKISPLILSKIFENLTGHLVILLDGDAWDNIKNLYIKLNVGKLYGKVRVVKLDEKWDISKVNEDFGREGVIDVLKSSFKIKESSL